MEKIQEINQLILDHSNNGLVYLHPNYMIEWENLAQYSEHPLAGRYKAWVVLLQKRDASGFSLSGVRDAESVGDGKTGNEGSYF